ncbi:MAG: DNA mismatch repair endonuclease MutL [Oscillatoria sp. Prado101]|nr:DNA mismatch repair endonuclease MutL [Oscillatoria sp. Prado101]
MLSTSPTRAAIASRIQPLPPEVVHLIAAGEVIDSLAAAVRELSENALDAGATRIAISLWPEHWRIRVADNGTGMDRANLLQAAVAHSTSKIHSSSDLWKITSLGFRGEALHSLAQLASLEICSRPKTPNKAEPESWRAVYNTLGELALLTAAALAPGTVVTVSDLFGRWPARRLGLPSPAQQLRSIQETIYHLALCHPQVTWQIEQKNRRWLTLSPGPTAAHILPQVLRDVRLSDLQQLTAPLPAPPNTEGAKGTLELVLGLPDRCHRQRPDWVKVAVNGRTVRAPELQQTILSSFGRTLPRDRYPVCFAHLRISPDQLDWNRHPAKAEIYLHNLPHWQEVLAGAIQQALNLNTANQPNVGQQRVDRLLKASEARGGYSASRTVAPAPNSTQESPPLTKLRALAQVHNTYIVTEHPAGLWLVEQHIAHERVLYEQLQDNWHLVTLEPPAILSQLKPVQVEQLQRIGIEIDPFGEGLWAARNAPALLAKRHDCADALLELSCGDLQTAQVATACRSAIRNGTPLTLPEMQTLLDQWQRTRHPRTCPHGRPIYLSLEERELARFFRRNWVIGKSHGI